MSTPLNESKPLLGKTALVTGGARGIGHAISLALAEQGADVALSYVTSGARALELVEKIRLLGVRAEAFQADQADQAQVESLVRNVVGKFGKLDILVNNAGVAAMGIPGDPGYDRQAMEHQFAVNVLGVAAAVRAAAPILSQGGRIITIGSCVAERVPAPGLADYSATKGAVAAYTRGWAKDFGPRGITVNVVQPGPIDTDMSPDEGEFAEMLKASTALHRFGKPEEVAAVVAFLASSAASYVTGAAIAVDGGINA